MARKEVELNEKNYESCRRLTRVIFREFVADPNALVKQEEVLGKEKGKSAFNLAIDYFATAVQIVYDHFPHHLPDFLTSVVVEEGSLPQKGKAARDADAELHSAIKACEEVTERLITAQNPSYKDATTLLTVIKPVLSRIGYDTQRQQAESAEEGEGREGESAFLAKTEQERKEARAFYGDKVKRWLVKVCETQSIDDLVLVRTIVTFLFSLLRSEDDIKIVSLFHFISLEPRRH